MIWSQLALVGTFDDRRMDARSTHRSRYHILFISAAAANNEVIHGVAADCFSGTVLVITGTRRVMLQHHRCANSAAFMAGMQGFDVVMLKYCALGGISWHDTTVILPIQLPRDVYHTHCRCGCEWRLAQIDQNHTTFLSCDWLRCQTLELLFRESLQRCSV